MVHHGGGLHDPGVSLAGLRIPALLGAEHWRLLLRLADEDHPFVLAEFAQVLGHHLVFALPLAKLDERYLMTHHEGLQRSYKAPAHRVHQGRRRQRLAAMISKEPHDSLLGLQPGDIDVEVHSVDPFDRELDMIVEDSGHALCYHAPGSGRAGFASCRRFDPCGPTEPGLPELVMNRRSEPLPYTPRRSEAKPR